MKKEILLIIFALCALLNVTPAYSGESVTDVVKMLNSKEWIVRERGVMAAMKISDNEQIKIELIKLLERENKTYEKKEEGLPADETSGEYYGELLDAIEQLKDPRAIKGLAGAADTGAGVTNALVEFGEVAIDPLIEVLDDSNMKPIEPYIIKTLDRVLKEKTSSVAHKNKVKHLLMDRVNKTPYNDVKQSIVAAFANFPDDDQVLNILETLIASDTYYEMRRVKGRPKTERVKVFPLKEEAEKTLGRIRAKRKGKLQELPAGTTQQNKPQ